MMLNTEGDKRHLPAVDYIRLNFTLYSMFLKKHGYHFRGVFYA